MNRIYRNVSICVLSLFLAVGIGKQESAAKEIQVAEQQNNITANKESNLERYIKFFESEKRNAKEEGKSYRYDELLEGLCKQLEYQDKVGFKGSGVDPEGNYTFTYEVRCPDWPHERIQHFSIPNKKLVLEIFDFTPGGPVSIVRTYEGSRENQEVWLNYIGERNLKEGEMNAQTTKKISYYTEIFNRDKELLGIDKKMEISKVSN